MATFVASALVHRELRLANPGTTWPQGGAGRQQCSTSAGCQAQQPPKDVVWPLSRLYTPGESTGMGSPWQREAPASISHQSLDMTGMVWSRQGLQLTCHLPAGVCPLGQGTQHTPPRSPELLGWAGHYL